MGSDERSQETVLVGALLVWNSYLVGNREKRNGLAKPRQADNPDGPGIGFPVPSSKKRTFLPT